MADADDGVRDAKEGQAFLRERLTALEKENADQARLLGEYRAMVENAADVMMRYDANLRHVFVSPAVEGLIGKKPRELLGKTHLEAGFSPAVSQYRENRIRQVFETGKNQESEYEMQGPSGPIILNWRLFLERGPSGEAASVLSVCRDITAHRRAERNFAALFDNLPEGFALFERQGVSRDGEPGSLCRILEANKVFCAMFGVDRERIRMKPACETLSGSILEVVRQASETTRVANRARFSVHALEIGRHLDISVHVPATGQFAILVMDVTSRMEFEERLLAAKEAAESAARAKSEFLANMSHELRTPMNGVLGMLQLLQGGALSAEQAEYVKIAMESGKCLLRIIGEILDLTRIEADKLSLSEEATDIREIMRQTQDAFAPKAQSRGVRLSLRVGDEMPALCHGDGYRLKQILFNLTDNAVKFTETGEVRIEGDVLDDAEDSGTARLLFSVSDTGIGIPRHKMRTIFEPFTQADGSITRKYQGLGLGLGVARRLVELMGGELYLESDPEQGTLAAFTVRFSRNPASGGRTLGEVHGPAPDGKGLRILLAEDDPANRLAMTRVLRKLGHEAVCAANGKEVLDILARDGAFDLALMDVRMPVMGGLEAAARIRLLPPPVCALPLVAVTAHAMSGDRERVLAAGMSGYIAKPVNFADLASMLDRFKAKSVSNR